jgi:hypothetical protein
LALEPYQTLQTLIRMPDLDRYAAREPSALSSVHANLEALGRRAWGAPASSAAPLEVEAARLESQRALYQLNRLRLYWGDDPDRYLNERSTTLMTLQSALEEPWQRWLAQQVPDTILETENPIQTLRQWAQRDATPSDNPIGRWFADEINLSGYRRLLEVASLNGLVEASQLSRALGGAPDPVQATLARIFIEEYGAGRLAKKHSTYFAQMLREQGMRTEPEAYFERVPWEVIAVINHAFYLAENKRLYLRFCGAFTYTEVSTPASFDGYAKAAKRLGLSDGEHDYWALHVREDTRHGAWMVDQVAAPLCERFPGRAHDVLFGYAQQRALEAMAGSAVAAACRRAAERAVH